MKKRYRWLTATVAVLVTLACGIGAYTALAAAEERERQAAEEAFSTAENAVLYVRGYDQNGALRSTGSGFILSEDGLALTAAHVVKDMSKVTVIHDGSELAAQVLLCNDETDIAALRLPRGTYPYVSLAQTAPAYGAAVRAIGHPSKDTVLITEGIVNNPHAELSGKQRMMVSCQLVNGMSGGPILNEFGEVVGIASGSVRTMSGIHLSVLTDELYATALQLKEEGK